MTLRAFTPRHTSILTLFLEAAQVPVPRLVTYTSPGQTSNVAPREQAPICVTPNPPVTLSRR